LTQLVTRTVDRLYGFRTPILLALQIALIVVANQAAFWLRFDGDVPNAQRPFNTVLIPLVVLVRMAVFLPFRLHHGIWRYASIWDLRNIVAGVMVSSFIFWSITHGMLGITSYPRSVFIIDAILLISLMGGVRLSRRLYTASSRHQGARRVLIYGAGDAGEMIARDMLQSVEYSATPIGFVDDDSRKVGRSIHDIPVLGGRQQLAQVIESHRPDELLLAIPSASRESLRSIVRALEPYKIRITTLPRVRDLIGERVDVGQIRQLRVEDLLARDPVGLDYGPVREFLKEKRVIVTGAGGSIGSELARQVASAHPATLVLLDRYENGLFHTHQELRAAFPNLKVSQVVADITDVRRIDQVFDEVQPQLIFHAAAHKHVPLMEDNPCEAVKNNVRGTRIVAEAALRARVERFVLISTDKAVNPTSVMGSTKRVAELIVDSMSCSTGTSFAAVRFGNVLASNGSVVPTFLAQIAKGGPVTVTDPEMRRFFMLIPEAVQLVLHAAALADRAPLFVLEMGEQVKVADMARDLIRLSGLVPDKDIEIVFTGVRPGEKLSEELTDEGEYTEPSLVDKILRVQTTSARDFAGFSEALARLEGLALEGRSDQVLHELQTVLAGYASARTQTSPV
jgi:FlaA1/EpsC-like NDP-sugar epimerase